MFMLYQYAHLQTMFLKKIKQKKSIHKVYMQHMKDGKIETAAYF